MGAMTPPSRKSCYNFRVTEINRVLDGDTIDVTIDLGFDLYKKERVRIAGVDTPEKRTRDLEEKELGIDATNWMKDSYNLSLGFSATWSRPLDKKLQDQCKEAAQTNIDLQKQITANKRLDFEIARLKNCGQLMKDGIMFHPKSPYYKICADVIVRDKNYITPHRHSIPSPSTSSKRVSTNAADLGGPLQTK